MTVLFPPGTDWVTFVFSPGVGWIARKWTPKKRSQPLRLRSFELFAGLTEEELAVIAQDCAEVTVQSGAILIRQGQVGRDVYLLEEGSVGIYRGEAAPSQFLVVLQPPRFSARWRLWTRSVFAQLA